MVLFWPRTKAFTNVQVYRPYIFSIMQFWLVAQVQFQTTKFVYVATCTQTHTHSTEIKQRRFGIYIIHNHIQFHATTAFVNADPYKRNLSSPTFVSFWEVSVGNYVFNYWYMILCHI